MQFLRRDLLKLRIFGHDIRIKVFHGVGLTGLLAILAILIFGFGVFVGFEYPYKTTPAPEVPATQTIPSCAKTTTTHIMGSCLPQTKTQNSALITSTNLGTDFSNNNPISSQASWNTIAKHTSFSIVKVNEGTAYTDPTAAPMIALAKRAGLVVGGYDFLHVCLVSATSEGDLFAVDSKKDGLVGKGVLPGVGDAEYPARPQCDVRTWLTTWADTVHKLLGVWPMFYTGAWWWNPYVGAFWPAHALSWISGYVARAFLPLPTGLTHLDLWQNTSNGFNGVTYSDMSVWLDSIPDFEAATGTTPVKPKPTPKPNPIKAVAKMIYKSPIVVSRKGKVTLTVGCSGAPCALKVRVFKAEIGLGLKKDSVVLRWREAVKIGATAHPKFTLSKTVLARVKRHRVKLHISSEKTQTITLKKL